MIYVRWGGYPVQGRSSFIDLRGAHGPYCEVYDGEDLHAG